VASANVILSNVIELVCYMKPCMSTDMQQQTDEMELSAAYAGIHRF